jgi:hypothetical protein
MGIGGEVTGTIYSIGETQQITDTFSKRTFVLTWPDGKDAKGNDRQQFVEFQVMGRKCADLDSHAEGEVVTVTYDLRGRLKSKGGGCFNELAAWKIGPASQQPAREESHGQRRTGGGQTHEQRARQRHDDGDGGPPPGFYDAPPPDDPPY